MRILDTALDGVLLVRAEPFEDARGKFLRVFCESDLAAHGQPFPVSQTSVSLTHSRGTLRGLHYQNPPHEEIKLVTCLRGSVHDVALDIRSGSPTFGRHVAHTLSAHGTQSICIPRGFAHGFLTLEDDTLILYHMTTPHCDSAARGVRWNDPRFAISWPFEPLCISDADRLRPDYIESGAS